jgi:hypothetical protein
MLIAEHMPIGMPKLKHYLFSLMQSAFIGAYMTGELLENGSIIASRSKFDTKIEALSAKMYFHYYGQLLHQQNMLQDFVRTG